MSQIKLSASKSPLHDNALDYLIDSLDAEDKQKFTFQLDILESRDARTRGK
ncbi:DUF5388 domain-containing protein [Levilactobacillus sp. N40-8-2]|uniref:DUF5388 domain-containing protein n=1 Tax=Levilactobacillus muriae TaxID=3238987 RepID=UPI0038B24B82